MSYKQTTELLAYVPESTPGTYDSSVETAAVTVKQRELSFEDSPERDDTGDFQSGKSFGSDETPVTKKPVTASQTVRLSPGEYDGPGGDTHKLNLTELLKNCGCNVTGVGTTDGTDAAAGNYVIWPDQSLTEYTMSMAHVMQDTRTGDYHMRIAAGVMSNFTLNFDGAGSVGTLEFSHNGKTAGDSKTVASGGAVPEVSGVMQVPPETLAGGTVTLTDIETSAETTLCITTVTMETGNDLQQVECQTDDSAILHQFINRTNPTLTINPLFRAKTDWDRWQAMMSSSKKYTVSIDSGNVELFIPRGEITDAPVSADNGTNRNELNIRPLENPDSIQPTWASTVVTSNVRYVPWYININEVAKIS